MNFEVRSEQNGTWRIVQVNDKGMIVASIGIIYSEFFARWIVKSLNSQVKVNART